jgi:hypothetical protein
VCYIRENSAPEGGELRMRTTNENERILENLGKNKQTRICPFLPIFCPFLGKKWAKTGKKNGRTKPNPGETGQNRKFRRILIRDRHALLLTTPRRQKVAAPTTSSTQSTTTISPEPERTPCTPCVTQDSKESTLS